jgi:hypothetical protein
MLSPCAAAQLPSCQLDAWPVVSALWRLEDNECESATFCHFSAPRIPPLADPRLASGERATAAMVLRLSFTTTGGSKLAFSTSLSHNAVSLFSLSLRYFRKYCVAL